MLFACCLLVVVAAAPGDAGKRGGTLDPLEVGWGDHGGVHEPAEAELTPLAQGRRQVVALGLLHHAAVPPAECREGAVPLVGTAVVVDARPTARDLQVEVVAAPAKVLLLVAGRGPSLN